MEFEEILKLRRSHRAYLDDPVDRGLVDQLIQAAIKAPVSCNLQVTQFIAIDDPSILKHLGKKVSYKFNYAPVCLVVLYDGRFTVKRHSIVSSTGMAVQNMILKATELGLGTCPMAGFGGDKIIRETLGIPAHMEICLLLSVGWPDHSFKMMNIPKVDESFIYNFNTYKGLKSIKDDINIEKYSVPEVIDYRKRIGPTYLDRFRLNSFNDTYYQIAFDFFNDKFVKKSSILNLLDLMSYDGRFLKLLFENKINQQINIVASDYIKHNLSFFEREFSVKTIEITEQNKINSQENFDFITFVFQDKFTPNLTELLNNIPDNLKTNGRVLIISAEEVFTKRLIKRVLKKIKKLIRKDVYNVYENSGFYKIGPYRISSSFAIKKIIKNTKLSLVESGDIHRDLKRGVVIRYYLLSL
jgi:nitroreductase